MWKSLKIHKLNRTFLDTGGKLFGEFEVDIGGAPMNVKYIICVSCFGPFGVGQPNKDQLCKSCTICQTLHHVCYDCNCWEL